MNVRDILAEELVRKWTGHLSLFAEKDPASAPTLPGHGSTNPRQDQDMNTQEHTPAPYADATPLAYENAYDDLETPISRALTASKAAMWVASILVDHPEQPDGYYKLSKEAVETIFHLVIQTEEACRAVDELWTNQHNTICRERAA